MRQLTLRISDQLARDLRSEAQRQGKSVNSLAATALTALVDPDAEGTELERIRARLRRAGLLAETHPLPAGSAPSRERVAHAGREAAKGKLLSDYVSEGRD
jgi:hypothetical protein